MAESQEQLRQGWDQKADEWRQQVGEHGDRNRRLNSDPVLWRMLGSVAGLKVLDAGCGTGYLAAKLAQAGATVQAIDFSPEMIRVARAACPGIDYRVDDAQTLATVATASVDRVVSNYVLMDLADLSAAVQAIVRVLKPGGVAVAIFSHPCFPQGRVRVSTSGDSIAYTFYNSYFECAEQSDPPWGHFTSRFTWFHRPLSVYTKTFREAGLMMDEIDEPHLTPDRYHEAPDARVLKNSRERPYSIAFRLVKKPA
ncbi:MAG TPA: methyltransferase domain-containing protein [Planctomycetota bacterium]|nr:methyltransferase domain-containing protein [Planctomycetota bacterium]